MRTYRVKEIWKTLQGEGSLAGHPAIFVRFVGCNMWDGYEAHRLRDAQRTGARCPLWCDTDFTREGSRSYSADVLAEEVHRLGGGKIPWCVLTGGEPLLQADDVLIEALHRQGMHVAIETNGTLALTERFSSQVPDWIVCSPKQPATDIRLEWMDELKLVVPDYTPDAYEALIDRVRVHEVGGRKGRYLWLQPEDGPRFSEAVALATEWALRDPRWRVSVQTHKILGIP